ncbi:DUF805 domain-containing protein [Marinobacter lacisalsi]|uniref:DUF805 domain-containing protein n=1 Tax=Marinobacter lacisalsi TaxID=475979 RepID=A0ABV8QGP8_9GAMM
MEHFLDGYRRFGDFSGRATREQFWMFFLFYIVVYIVLSIVDAFIGFPALSGLFALASLIPHLAYGARRLHDTGRSGWWQLIALVPLVGLVLIFFLVQKSEGDNRFGPAPGHVASPSVA